MHARATFPPARQQTTCLPAVQAVGVQRLKSHVPEGGAGGRDDRKWSGVRVLGNVLKTVTRAKPANGAISPSSSSSAAAAAAGAAGADSFFGSPQAGGGQMAVTLWINTDVNVCVRVRACMLVCWCACVRVCVYKNTMYKASKGRC